MTPDPACNLQPSSPCTQVRNSVRGVITVDISYQHQLQIVVVLGAGPSLLGRDWLQHIRLDWARINLIRIDASTRCWPNTPLCSRTAWETFRALQRLSMWTPPNSPVSTKPDRCPTCYRPRWRPNSPVYRTRESSLQCSSQTELPRSFPWSSEMVAYGYVGTTS